MRDVFVSARGQHDNLGDSVLRRGLLDTLRPLGRLHVNVQGLSPGYLGALGLNADDVLVREGWGARLVRGARHGYVYGYNAGETYASRAYAAHCVKMAPLLALSRARGGSAFHLGLGLRAPHRLWAPVLRGALAVCDEVSWRDPTSRGWVGSGGVAPDWAYASGAYASGAHDPGNLGSGAHGAENLAPVPLASGILGSRAEGASPSRDLLVVSLRFDRPPPGPSWLAVVRETAAAHGLAVVAAPQVGRDSARARELADELGGDLVDWDGVDHAAAERQVRALYARARFVMSDRLHALVLGHTEGAVPVGLGTADVTKLSRTLAAVGVEECAWDAQSGSVAESVERVARLDARREEILARAREAHTELERLRARVAAVVHEREPS